MRYRILAVLAALTAAIGLAAAAAPAASAAVSARYVRYITPRLGPYNIMTNDNHSVGITYPGPGNQATITTNPGNSHVTQLGGGIVTIHNDNGNCLRMRDAANSFAVMEESGCSPSTDANERWVFEVNSNDPQLFAFKNVATGQFLGVTCPAKNGNKVWGEPNQAGTCIQWLLQPS